MTAQAAIERLLAIHPKGFDLSLERISSLLAKLGNPQLSIPPAFHVAGTNGKGSTVAFIRAILEAAGKSVHVHTSPHLVNWHERYRLGRPGGGVLVSDAALEAAVEKAEQANGGHPITVFEIMSAVGFLLFAEYPADYCVIEVGLGGRFDATNVIADPCACVITPVAMDHEAYLGDTIGKIAFEKAGIIKQGHPVVVAHQQDAAIEVIERVAAERRAPLVAAGRDYDFHSERGRFIFQDERGLLDLEMPRLVGTHQLSNAASAIAAVRMVLPQTSSSVFDRAMRTVTWPGRFERLKPGRVLDVLPEQDRERADIWIDGGHNPHAGAAIASQLAALEERSPMPVVLIAGMITTKEPLGFFQAFQGLVSKVFTVPVEDSESGFDPEVLADVARRAGLQATPFPSVKAALRTAMETNTPGNAIRVLICGSLYLIGAVLRENGTPPV